MAGSVRTPMSDEDKLAELGYKQELQRGWSGFSNFAISFSIISVLAGCFTTYGQALNNGGPVAISIAWPPRRSPQARCPWSVFFVVFFAMLITIPAYFPNSKGSPVAFLAVTSIATIGLYIAYSLPVYLRWRMGERFETGPWTLGAKCRWINPIAFVWVAICVVIFCLPFTPAGVYFSKQFSWSSVNYAPLITIAVIVSVTLWYLLSARKTFKGPVRTIEVADDGVTIVEPSGA